VAARDPPAVGIPAAAESPAAPPVTAGESPAEPPVVVDNRAVALAGNEDPDVRLMAMADLSAVASNAPEPGPRSRCR
jgi:hypothetical protein